MLKVYAVRRCPSRVDGYLLSPDWAPFDGDVADYQSHCLEGNPDLELLTNEELAAVDGNIDGQAGGTLIGFRDIDGNVSYECAIEAPSAYDLAVNGENPLTVEIATGCSIVRISDGCSDWFCHEYQWRNICNEARETAAANADDAAEHISHRLDSLGLDELTLKAKYAHERYNLATAEGQREALDRVFGGDTSDLGFACMVIDQIQETFR